MLIISFLFQASTGPHLIQFQKLALKMFKTLDIQLKNMKKEQELRNKLRRLRKTIYEEDMGLNPYSGSFKVNRNRENSFFANKIGLNITNSSTTPDFRSKL